MNEIMNYGNNNENYDMQQLMNIMGQFGMNVNNMSKQMGIIATSLEGVKNDMDGLTDRMNRLEQKEEITTEQKAMINAAIHRRCYEILGNDPFEIEKYSRGFIARCYSECKKYAGMGARYEETKKENYQRIIDYVEAWIPSCGCAELKSLIDEKAKCRRKAIELGYSH